MPNDLYITIPDDFEKKYLEYKNKTLGVGENNTSSNLHTKGSNGYIKINDNVYDLGPAKNIPYLLISTLYPLGIEKRIEIVYKDSTPEVSKFNKDSNISLASKKEILRNRIKEVQRILKNQKPKIKLTIKFKKITDTAYIEQK